MANLNAILNERIKKSDQTSKMAAMAKQSSTGNLTSFTGVFSVAELNEKEKQLIENILKEYANQDTIQFDLDFQTLLSITSEVKAINNQAALLHGERIKKAHQILTRYQEGAFTAWLLAAYGNRQTPYNLMQYYEFYEALPKDLRPQLELMPRQAVYTLATRTGELEKKQAIVKAYEGQTKAETIAWIRQVFPIDQKDKRKQRIGENTVQLLERLLKQVEQTATEFTRQEKKKIASLLQNLQQLIKDS